MATDVTRASVPAAAPARERGRLGPFRGRFLLVYGALVLVFAGGIAAAIVFATRGGHSKSAAAAAAPWSSWRPSSPTTSPAVQIALHTTKSYLLPSGTEFLHIVTSPPRWQDAPVRALIVVAELGGENQITLTADSNTIEYSLCGPSPDCSLPSTAANAAGELVVMERQALQLALTTFKYVPDAQNVFVVMPPGTASGPTVAFWRRGDLAAQLHTPLAKTIPPYQHGLIGVTKHDVDAIHQLVSHRLYSIDVQRTADGSDLFVLKRLLLPGFG